MDERDYKALNKEPMSNTEETDKLSFKEYIKMLPKEEIYLSVVKWEVIFKIAESFASMRVEQECKDKNAIIEQVKFLLKRNCELEQEVKELKQEIYLLNNSSNFQ